MNVSKLLVANRGEIAVRILRAAAELNIATAAVYSDDDPHCLHTRKADEAHSLGAAGPAAFLDMERILDIARRTRCDAIHPGYGFLSENAAFARLCAEAGLTFVGPSAETLEVLGDKVGARRLAERLSVPVLPGTSKATSAKPAHAPCLQGR